MSRRWSWPPTRLNAGSWSAGSANWRVSGAGRRKGAYSRREPLDAPSLVAGFPRVAEAVVHAAVAPLPELDHLGREQVAAPVLGPLEIGLGEISSELGEAAVELIALDRPALGRDRRCDLAVPGTAREVGVGVLRGEPLDPPPGSNLAIELAPVEDQRRAGVSGQLLALGALVVGEEAEPVGPESLQQHHPGIGESILIDRGQGHRLGQRHVLLGIGEPGRELVDRISRKVLAIEWWVLAAPRAHSFIESFLDRGRSSSSPSLVSRFPGHSSAGERVVLSRV